MMGSVRSFEAAVSEISMVEEAEALCSFDIFEA